ncbi:major facilitator superfamily domain-containing protein [Halteromyces radiatus]|uniref:major facilitator superfamily domain-containing protein n=1 Tax=Halteromyces radiatus TaxID=101107 RepID=UPI0022212003|nr:major facilitator superfamily domain-containing protein [Halteromyces radiatus]KAI8097422.1 major facilitator superfamily domain-containing protein [Halteromyces radiatus]
MSDSSTSTISDERTHLLNRSFEERQPEQWKDLIPHLPVLLTSCFMSIVIGLNDGAIGFMIPQFKQYYGVSNQALSFLFLSNATGYIICAPLNGLFVQSLGQKGTVFMAGGFALLAYLLIMNGFDYRLTCLLMVFQGAGMALLDAGMNVLAAHLPFATLMLNIVHALYSVGAAVSPVVGSTLIANKLSWKWLYAFLSIISLVNMIIIAIGLRHTEKENSSSVNHGDDTDDTVSTDRPLESSELQVDKSARQMIHDAIMNRITLLCALYILIYVGLEVTLGGWGYTYLIEGKHGDVIQMGRVLSLYWAAMAIGRILLGYLSGRYGERSSINVFTLLTLIGIVNIWQVDDLRIDATVYVIIGFLLGPMFPTAISVASKSIPKEMIPTSIGFIAGVGASGAAFLPFITGQIAGHYGMLCLPIVCLVMAIVMQVAWILMPSMPV